MKTHVLLIAALITAAGCKKKPPEQVGNDAPVTTQGPPAEAVPVYVQDLMNNFRLVYFDTDSSSLGDKSKSVLDANVKILQEHPNVKVQITGHADERGTEDYNLALGDKRADVVKKYLVMHGVAPNRVDVLSFGEERPAATGHNETAWSQNRRAEFVITWQ